MDVRGQSGVLVRARSSEEKQLAAQVQQSVALGGTTGKAEPAR
jgi:hypothetical protein